MYEYTRWRLRLPVPLVLLYTFQFGFYIDSCQETGNIWMLLQDVLFAAGDIKTWHPFTNTAGTFIIFKL